MPTEPNATYIEIRRCTFRYHRIRAPTPSVRMTRIRRRTRTRCRIMPLESSKKPTDSPASGSLTTLRSAPHAAGISWDGGNESQSASMRASAIASEPAEDVTGSEAGLTDSRRHPSTERAPRPACAGFPESTVAAGAVTPGSCADSGICPEMRSPKRDSLVVPPDSPKGEEDDELEAVKRNARKAELEANVSGWENSMGPAARGLVSLLGVINWQPVRTLRQKNKVGRKTRAEKQSRTRTGLHVPRDRCSSQR